MTRRLPVAVALGATLLTLTACATSTNEPAATAAGSVDAAASDGSFPVTIRHAYGSTTITKAPTRVATVGWVDQDMAAALGVVPVGATAMTWGGNAKKSTDWFDAQVTKLGANPPVRYSDTDGVPVTDIAKVAPDLILATGSGITKEEYAKLSKIAPVVAMPGAPFVTPWQTSLAMVGTALGRTASAKKVATETEKVVADAKKAHPQIQGKTMAFVYLNNADLSQLGVYGAEDNRVRTMTAFGFVNAPIVATAVKPGQFYGVVSAERAATVASDVLLTYADSATDVATWTKNPLVGAIPALKSGHVYAETDKQVGLSVTNPTPLSMPYVVEKFLPGAVAATTRR